MQAAERRVSARPSTPPSPLPSIAARLAGLDWAALEAQLDERGYARTPPLLTDEECSALVGLYGEDRRFRSRVDMARYRFGVGEYQYFAAPLPGPVAALRTHAYPHLAAIANRWASALGASARYPAALPAFLRVCAKEGQKSCAIPHRAWTLYEKFPRGVRVTIASNRVKSICSCTWYIF